MCSPNSYSTARASAEGGAAFAESPSARASASARDFARIQESVTSPASPQQPGLRHCDRLGVRRVQEHIGERVAHFAESSQGARVEAIPEHSAAALERAVDCARETGGD
jgi:hypothetical protein